MKTGKLIPTMMAVVMTASAHGVPVALKDSHDDFPGTATVGENNVVHHDSLLQGNSASRSEMNISTPWKPMTDDDSLSGVSELNKEICCGGGNGAITASLITPDILAGSEFDDIVPSKTDLYHFGAKPASVAVAEQYTIALLGLGMIGLAIARSRA